MLDVATGMQYLHGQNPVIIHRDLKSLNVLIDENWVTKVWTHFFLYLVCFFSGGGGELCVFFVIFCLECVLFSGGRPIIELELGSLM